MTATLVFLLLIETAFLAYLIGLKAGRKRERADMRDAYNIAVAAHEAKTAAVQQWAIGELEKMHHCEQVAAMVRRAVVERN